MPTLPGISRLTRAQRKEVEEMITAAVAKLRDELTDRNTEAIGFKYEPVSDFEE